jgi:hypothetical protein
MNRYSRRVAGTVFLECECCSNALDTERNHGPMPGPWRKQKGCSALWQTEAGAWMRFCPRCTEEIEDALAIDEMAEE